jgi:DNA-binding IclR family transcriptional regulator
MDATALEPPDPLETPDKARAGIQSVEVGFALLEVLADAVGPLMLRDLAAAAGMSAAKAHRYLVSFQRLGLVVQDVSSARYELGPATLRLGLATLARQDAVKMARERLPLLLERTGHTLALAVWGNHGPTIVHWLESARAPAVNLRLGDVMPLLSSATGRCFLAFGSQGGRADRSGPLLADELALACAQTRSDLPQTPEAVQALAEQTRQRGYGWVHDVLLPGISGVCAPVFDANGQLALGVLSMGVTASFNIETQGGAVLAMARQLSADLGCRT